MEIFTQLEEEVSLLLEELHSLKSERSSILEKQMSDYNRLLQENMELREMLAKEQHRNSLAQEKVQRIIEQLKVYNHN